MKQFYQTLILIFLFPAMNYAQVDSTPPKNDSIIRDTIRPRVNTPVRTIDTTRIADSLIVSNDSLLITDSLRIADSIRSIQVADSMRRISVISSFPPVDLKDGDKKEFKGKELLFYYIVFLLVLFGLLRRIFEKYFYDLFRVFFKTTLKQRQTQEQLLQSPLPSVFMNAFFILSAGLYANFLLEHFQLSVVDNFWLQYLYCAGALTAIYIVKYIGLKITGWLFNVKNATDSYIFIVFIINKMLGIFLLPFLLLIAFTREPLYGVAFVLSWFGIAILLIYRFILSYSAVRKEVKLNSFHFALYIIAFEIIPLLLIYKLLLLIF